ncbi:permease [Campylobacter insulaenigrae]|uniref:permease n=1 Tax=Campylobacter insulaenigrae TaxID=260714 RepID=UPI002152C22A|nr:permease [Campylobacter insulaenigrae]MCR6594322.1 permease [Campylobacter insulaenigrae]
MISEKIVMILKDFLVSFGEISILFLLINMLISFINERYAKFFNEHLKKDSFSSYIKAIVLGTLTPFCSCSSIPLLNAFLKNGVPLGVCISYLITSPLINPIIIMVFIFSFGFKITLFYLGFLFVIILSFAFLISRIDTHIFFNRDFITDSLEKSQTCCFNNNLSKHTCCSKNDTNFIEKKQYRHQFKKIFLQSFKEYIKILPYITVGMAIGALIYGLFPQNFFENYLKDYSVLGVFIAAFIGVLLYMNCTSLIPVALALSATGVPLGIMMSFLIAGAGCSLPELILLKRIFKFNFLILFASAIVFIAISFGILMFFI